MLNYESYYNDNLNGKFNNEIEDYNKYIKLYYIDNSKCPVDLKKKLEKERSGDIIKMHCDLKKNKSWNITIQMPKIINLYDEHLKISKIFNNDSAELKTYIREKMELPIYNSNNDKELKNKINYIKDIEKSLNSINNIFNVQKEELNKLYKNKQKLLIELTELNKNRKIIYKNIVSIDNNKKHNILEIFKNEKNPNEKRLIDISKNLNLEVNIIKDWIFWFNNIHDYLIKNKELKELNDHIILIQNKYKKINDSYIIRKPEINILEKHNDIKKNINKNKKIKIKISKKKNN